MTIIGKLKELGYKTVGEEFYRYVDTWKSWYRGNVKGFHDYRFYNGKEWVKDKRATLNMAKTVCEEWARLLMNEKVHITLEGEREQAFVDDVFTKNNFEVKTNEMQELAFALGTVAIVPRVVGAAVGVGNAINGGDIRFDYVTVEHIYPIGWENGIITECAFSSFIKTSDKTYLYLQIHVKNDKGMYDIHNRFYAVESGNVSREVDPAEVWGYENTPPITYTSSDKRQFVILRPNIANNVDYSVPLGISVFANAIDALMGVDSAFDCFVNEFDNGALMLMVKAPATDYFDGKPTLPQKDRRFYLLPEDTTDGIVVNPISPQLRAEQLTTGLQMQINLLASKCGFGENYYRFNGGSLATATQVISENSNMFRTVKKHEIILEEALIELCRIVLMLGNKTLNAGLDEAIEISVDFDDSIIEDKTANFNRDLQLLSAGILNDWEFRMRWMNEDEETARAALPKMQELTTEEQDEVE